MYPQQKDHIDQINKMIELTEKPKLIVQQPSPKKEEILSS